MDRITCQNCQNQLGLLRSLAITPGPGTFITRRTQKTPNHTEETEYRMLEGSIVCSECTTPITIQNGTVV